jgi:hypothetical protein
MGFSSVALPPICRCLSSSSSLPARSMAVDVAGDLLDESTGRGVDGSRIHDSVLSSAA